MASRQRPFLLITCEHGGREVPAPYRALFRGQGPLLRSHRGHDAGALEMARHLGRRLDAPVLEVTITRLLVDANRPEGSRRLFGDWGRRLSPAERERLLEEIHRPHWRRVEQQVREQRERTRTVVHLAVHSFTPLWKGRRRPVDLGLLYDPSREEERAFCRAWAADLSAALPSLQVRCNQPYRGRDPGLPTSLRSRFPAGYLGIELEASAGWSTTDSPLRRRIRRAVCETLRRRLEDLVH